MVLSFRQYSSILAEMRGNENDKIVNERANGLCRGLTLQVSSIPARQARALLAAIMIYQTLRVQHQELY